MLYTVSKDMPPSLGATGAAATLQGIALLLRTRQGSCPMYRGFGLPGDYLSLPVNAAQNVLRNEITDAVREYCPEASVSDVIVRQGDDGDLTITVEVDISE